MTPPKPTPDFYIWTTFISLLGILLLFILGRFIWRISKIKGSKNITPIVVFTGSLFFFTGCDEQKSPENDMRAQKFLKEFNLDLKSKVQLENSMKFSSIEEAEVFFRSIRKTSKFDSEVYGVIAKNLSPVELNRFNEVVKSNSAKLKAKSEGRIRINPWDYDDLPFFPDFGDGAFSQVYAPWNSISVALSWNNGTLASINTQLSGWTLGIGWNQVSWTQTGYLNGIYSFNVTYYMTYNIFIEGIGTVWTTEYHVMSGVYNSGTGVGALFDCPDGC